MFPTVFQLNYYHSINFQKNYLAAIGREILGRGKILALNSLHINVTEGQTGTPRVTQIPLPMLILKSGKLLRDFSMLKTVDLGKGGFKTNVSSRGANRLSVLKKQFGFPRS